MQEPTARAGSQRTVWLNGIPTPRLRSRVLSKQRLRGSVNLMKRRRNCLQYRLRSVIGLRDCCQVKPNSRTETPYVLAGEACAKKRMHVDRYNRGKLPDGSYLVS